MIFPTNTTLVYYNPQFCLGLETRGEQKPVPFMYCLPILHSPHSPQRFIITFSQCSTKPTIRVLSKLFKKILIEITSFHQKSTFYENHRSYILQNSYSLIKKMNNINSKRKARDISTFDFSFLYTNLQHQDIIQVSGIV